MEEEHTKEPSHNNPEEAAHYFKAVDTLLKLFVSDVHGFNHYACQVLSSCTVSKICCYFMSTILPTQMQ